MHLHPLPFSQEEGEAAEGGEITLDASRQLPYSNGVMNVQPLIPLAATLAAFIGLWAIGLLLEKRIEQRFHESLRIFRTLVLPCIIAGVLLKENFGYNQSSIVMKTTATALGFSAVWFLASVLKAIVFLKSSSESLTSRTPRLLVDILRLIFVVVGFLLVYSGIWQKDVSPLLTTFGVGSLVLGLALQDTLGNLFAGLSLVFERPIAVGDWIQVGDQVGRVQQINWRSTRIVTRELTEITIPNSAIGKERLHNFSTPTRVHGFKVSCGFSYDAPPNTVKEMLFTAAVETPGVLQSPAPEARTFEFGAYAIQYELRVFIADYDETVSVRNELMSRIWYHAKRRGISIPFPITTLYKTEVPFVHQQDAQQSTVRAAIQGAALFQDLSSGDITALAEESTLERFACGERLIKEGDIGESFYIIVEGRCSVMANSKDARLVSVATLEKGSVVGEISLLSGTPRNASVFAASELLLVRISKDALGHLLARHASILHSFAHYAAQRTSQIGLALDKDSQIEIFQQAKPDENALRERLRRFFGLGPTSIS